MSAHTPGPWNIVWKQEWSDAVDDMADSHELAEHIRSGNTDRYDGVSVAGTCDGCNLITAANARLIAAAPDLLEALEDVLNGGCGCYLNDNGEECETCGSARASIAKARGTT